MTKPTLNLRVVELQTSNIALPEIIRGLERFKADLEAKGVQVSLTVEGLNPRMTEPIIIHLESESRK